MRRPILFILLICVVFIVKAQEVQYEIIVSQDGSGDFQSVQQAIDATKAFPDKRITIHIKNGIYHEKVKVPSWNTRLSLIGENVEKTIISYDDHFKKIKRGRNSTFYTYTMLVEADDFFAKNLTIENTSGPVGQAVALHVEGNRCAFKNCRILGNQDTYYGNGENSHQLFLNCHIEGTTDFIFGSATVVFKECTIVSKKDSYITAASTEEGKEFGFIFINCDLMAEEGVTKVYLGRPWRPYAKTVFIHCSLGNHIVAEGWKEWSNSENKGTTFYAEYDNNGAGAKTDSRVYWAHQLSDKEVGKYTLENILGSWLATLELNL